MRGDPPEQEQWLGPGRGSGTGDRLHICLVSQSYLPYHGGITEHVWHLAHALTRRGHWVSILTGAPAGNGHPADPDPPGVQVIRLGRTFKIPSHGGRACVVLAGGRRASLARRFAVPPDLVHVQSPLEPFLPLWALRDLPGVKIGTFHTGGSRPHWGYLRFARCLAPYARRLDHRIAVSREAARFVADHFPGRYEVIPNGVDVERFAHRAARNEPPGPPVILHVGRLDPRKGLRSLLAAFERLRDRPATGAAELWLVGDGPERGWLARQAALRRLPVRLLGAVPRARLPEIYARADLFVAAATDGESFGISLLEAMASGVPILAAGNAGYAETLGDNGAARFFPPGDGARLAREIAALLADETARARMRAAGLRRVQAFAWERIAARVEGAYRQALASTVAG